MKVQEVVDSRVHIFAATVLGRGRVANPKFGISITAQKVANPKFGISIIGHEGPGECGFKGLHIRSHGTGKGLGG